MRRVSDGVDNVMHEEVRSLAIKGMQPNEAMTLIAATACTAPIGAMAKVMGRREPTQEDTQAVYAALIRAIAEIPEVKKPRRRPQRFG